MKQEDRALPATQDRAAGLRPQPPAASSQSSIPSADYTPADKANACRVYNAYRRSYLPCEGAAIIAELRRAAFAAGAAYAQGGVTEGRDGEAGSGSEATSTRSSEGGCAQ